MSGTDYFTYTNLQANTLARASDVNARVASIQGGFAKLPLPDKIREDRVTAVVDQGTANALVVSLDTAPSAYSFGLELTIRVSNSNTGPVTLNVNGLGAVAVKRADGSALQTGDLAVGNVLKFIYDGASFRLLGASETAVSAIATAAAVSAAAAAASAVAADASAISAAINATNAAASATAAAASAVAAALAVSGYLPLAGGIMTGALTLSGAPTSNLHAATKKYVDDAVFAAGAYTADGATITLSTGQFSLTTIANNRLFGNVSGGTAKPGALTGTQATALLDTFTASLKGLVPPPTTATGKVLKDDGTWTNNVGGNAASATALQTARTIAISGAVTGTATSFDGSGNITIPITALDVGAATTGTLAVARGGTGVTTSTGTGANVLSDSPALTGAPTAPTLTAGDNSTKLATSAFVAAAIAPLAPLASPPLTGTPTAPTAASGTATTQLATTAFVDRLLDVPSNSKTANYQLVLADRGQGLDFNGTSLTCTIPANGTVAFPLGTTAVLTNLNATALSIAITTDTLTMAGSTTTGTRTLAQNGMATLRKVGATSWLISGAGLS